MFRHPRLGPADMTAVKEIGRLFRELRVKSVNFEKTAFILFFE